MINRLGRLGFVFALLARSAFADVDSGPPVGQPAPALKVQTVMNGQVGEAMDIAAFRGEQPTIYIFLPAARFDRPAGRFVKQLDGLTQKRQMTTPTLQVVLVWIVDDAQTGSTRTSAIQRSLQLQASEWTVWTGAGAGPDGWVINDKAAVTVVITRGKDVQAKFGYDSVNETVVPAVDLAVGNALAP